MLKKKFFAKALAFAMATGMLAAAAPVAGPAVQALASGTTDPAPQAKKVSVTIDYSDFAITITPGKNKAQEADSYVFLEVCKKENDEKQGTVYPYSCNGGAVTVNLSFLKASKASYLRVWGDKSEEKVSVTVSAQPTKIKYKYAAQTFPTLEGSDSTTSANQAKLKDYYMKSFGITGDAVNSKFMINGLYGGNINIYTGSDDYFVDTDVLETLKIAGGTLVIREMPVEEVRNASGEVTKAGAPMGPEAKVKIPASPKAPKVSVDYAKGVVKIPKKGQYGMLQGSEIKYVDLANGGTLTPKVILGNIADKIGLEDDASNTSAPTEKTDFIMENLKDGFNLIISTKDEKKGVSLPSFVTIKATAILDTDEWSKIRLVTEDESGNEVKTEIAQYDYSDEAGVKVTFSSGAFEYEDGGKWKKISSGKVIKGKTGDLKIRQAGVKDKDESKASLPSDEITIKKPVDQSVVDMGSTTTVTIGTPLDITPSVTKDRTGNSLASGVSITSIKWSSSNTEVATVASATATKGSVTGKTAGRATITAVITLSDETTVTGTIELTVSEATSGG